MAKIYAASSWRNEHYDSLVSYLTQAGHEVWNWRKPPTGGAGFSWTQTGLPSYQHGDKISASDWKNMLRHPVAQLGFASDLCGMNGCDVGVLLFPCGRSAHLEAGWLAARGKKVHALVLEPVEPDLMVLALNGTICGSIPELMEALVRGAA
jgi:hypothetical protein